MFVKWFVLSVWLLAIADCRDLLRIELRSDIRVSRENGKDVTAKSEGLYRDGITYYGFLSLGTPGQQLSVLFDTGFPWLWVYSKRCSCGNIGCLLHRKYDSAKSRSYKELGPSLYSLSYPTTIVTGYLSNDTLQIGGLNIQNQTFLEAVDVAQNPAGDLVINSFESMVGLPFNLTAFYGVPPILSNMYAQGLIPKLAFSFQFDQNSNPPNGGAIIFGGSDPKYNGKFAYIPVYPNGYLWWITMNRASISGMTFCEDGCDVLIDSGSSTFAVPTNVSYVINKAIGGKLTDDGTHVVPCDSIPTLPKIVFVFGKNTFEMEAKDYIFFHKKMGICVSSFDGLDELKETWVFGIIFMRKFTIEFDAEKKRIGIATPV